MTTPERSLRLVLRIVAAAALLALPCIFLPYAWMNAVHRALGMGELPREPIVGYLARSTSFFYAMLGGLLWITSYDLRRYRPVIGYLAVATVLLGALLLGVDLIEGMPLGWSLGEGPLNAAIGILILVLVRRIEGLPSHPEDGTMD